jgi:hypothetical protein
MIKTKSCHEEVKWKLGFVCFWNAKMGFIHWYWDSHKKQQLKIGIGLRFKRNSGNGCGSIENKNGICSKFRLGNGIRHSLHNPPRTINNI